MALYKQDWAIKLEHLHRAAIAVARSHDVGEALQTIVDAAREVIDAEMAAVGVPGQPGEPMAHFVVSGMSHEQIEKAGQPPMGRGVLGVLLNDGQSLNVMDIREHAEYLGLPAHHPDITSFLGVPVRSGGQIIGDLYLANKISDDAFSSDDQRLAEMLAAHAAVVISNLRYHEKQEELAVIREHTRLAPVIEDDVLQTLYGAGLLLNTLNYESAAEARSQVGEIQGRLDVAIRHLREHLIGLSNGNEEDYKYP